MLIFPLPLKNTWCMYLMRSYLICKCKKGKLEGQDKHGALYSLWNCGPDATWRVTKIAEISNKKIVSFLRLEKTEVACGSRIKYRGADKSLARPGRKQANVSVRMVWISFGALPCRGKETCQLASRCCWNRARHCHASELVSLLAGLRTYQHPGTSICTSPPTSVLVLHHFDREFVVGTSVGFRRSAIQERLEMSVDRVLGSFRKTVAKFVMSVCLYVWNNSVPAENNMKILYLNNFKKSAEIINVSSTSDKKTGTVPYMRIAVRLW